MDPDQCLIILLYSDDNVAFSITRHVLLYREVSLGRSVVFNLKLYFTLLLRSFTTNLSCSVVNCFKGLAKSCACVCVV